MSAIEYRYGRLLSDFEVGATYEHPWEVTVDGGTVALFQASFLDATPIYSSAVFAKSCGLAERPLHPLLCLNLGLSFSVHDVSEQAIAHLAYIDVRFPEAGYAGDTVRARSTVLGVKPASSGDKGVVHVRTILENEKGRVLCAFERKALIRAGKLGERPAWAAVSGAADARHRVVPVGAARARRRRHGRRSARTRRLRGRPGVHARDRKDDRRVGAHAAHGAGAQLAPAALRRGLLQGQLVHQAARRLRRARVVVGGDARLARSRRPRAVGGRARRRRASQRRRRRRHALRRVEGGRRRRRQGHVPPRRRQEPHVGVGVRAIRRRAVRRRARQEGRPGPTKIKEKVVEITRTLHIRRRA